LCQLFGWRRVLCLGDMIWDQISDENNSWGRIVGASVVATAFGSLEIRDNRGSLRRPAP